MTMRSLISLLATSAVALAPVAAQAQQARYLNPRDVQEALVHAWRELPNLRDPDRFNAWLHRLVVNACADEGRSQRRWMVRSASEVSAATASGSPRPLAGTP